MNADYADFEPQRLKDNSQSSFIKPVLSEVERIVNDKVFFILGWCNGYNYRAATLMKRQKAEVKSIL